MSNVTLFPHGAPANAVENFRPIADMVGETRIADEATWETDPPILPDIPQEIRRICYDELGCSVVAVAARSTAVPLSANCLENVARRMLKSGCGRPVFGWCVRSTPLFVAAKFHVALRTQRGPVDVTPPATDGED
jgi:hypothetical protein